MTTIEFIDLQQYKNEYQNKVGTLMFPGNLYDCEGYVDKKKLRKLVQIPKGRRVLHILIHTDTSSGFKNILNNKIPYKNPLCCNEDNDGSYLKNGYWCNDFPVGDCIIVLSNPKLN